jgi:hypothetical protein
MNRTNPSVERSRHTARAHLAAAALAVAATLGAHSTPAAAEDQLLYVGGSAGQANTKVGQIAFNESDLGWKLTVGTHPIGLLGAELSYIDFGKPTATYSGVNNEATTKGAVAWGMIYAPLPLPIFDVYGKLGLARLQANASAYLSGCSGPGPGCTLFAFNKTNTQPAYGAGAQAHWGPVAARIEYEHYQTTGGSPSLLSVGVIYSFL